MPIRCVDRPSWIRALVGCCCVAGALGCAWPAGAQPASPPRQTERLRPLEVRVNQAKAGIWTLLERDGTLYAPEDALIEWRMNLPPRDSSIQTRGETWFPLNAIPGFDAAFNEVEQSVDLVFSPGAFATTRLTRVGPERVVLSPVEPAVFLNYDLNADHSGTRGQRSQQNLGMLGEFGVATDWGLFSSSYAGRNLVTRNIAGAAPQWQRLETSFTRDFLSGGTTLRLGDLSSRSGMIGRSVYFGGVQWSRNFSLQPGFISQPIPSLAGTSNAPSTVELYINNVLRQTTNVPAGPFTVDNAPALTGAGNARLVVRDILGRETVIEQPFFSHGALLEAGLTDWSMEAGALRRNLGLSNTRYAEKVVSGLYRQGLTKTLTGELRASATRPQQEASLAIGLALTPWPILLQAGLGASRTEQGRGGNWLLSLEQASLGSGALLRTEGATAGYRGVGQDLGVPVTRRQNTLTYHVGDPDWGSLGLSAARSTAGDGRMFTAASLSYSVRVGERGSFNLSMSGLAGDSSGRSVSASFNVPLDRRINSVASITRQAGALDGYVSASSNPESAEGWGWNLLTGERGDQSFVEGGANRMASFGGLRLNASGSRGQQNLRAGAQGALVWIDGSVFASRRNSSGLALVEVAGYEDVGVGVMGQIETRTRASGRALLTQLTPYRPNAIRLNASDLPISAELDSVELTVVPAARSAVKLVFPVRSGRAALIRVVFEDGLPAPAGAEVGIVGDAQVFYMARRGEVFVTGLADAATLELKWKERSCKVAMTLPPGKPDDITRVGPVICTGVPR